MVERMTTARRADPYRDLSVIDARAPRFNQTVVALGALISITTGAWPILALLGAQLAVSVVFGRQYCLPCLFYFEVVQPRWGEGALEDSRAPRFANILGALFLLGGSLAWGLGFEGVGRALGALVAVLATIAATSGLCVGCEVYKLLAKLRGVKGGVIERIDLEQLGVATSEALIVLFTHPLCSECQEVTRSLDAQGRRQVRIDVSKRRDLAKKYGVSLVPFAVSVSPDGRVTARLQLSAQ